MTPGELAQIIWFKRDLRLEDHAALRAAAEAGPVLPLYIIEPEYWAQPDVARRQYDFLIETLRELADQLHDLGAPLLVRVGEAVPVLQGLHDELDAMTLWSTEETGNAWTYQRDRAVGRWARESGIAWHECGQGGVVRRLASRDGWARHWAKVQALPILARPALRGLDHQLTAQTPPDAARLGLGDDHCWLRQTGGRAAGLKAMTSFLRERCEPYRTAMSAPAEGAVHCSRLSPYLALGAISMREAHHAGSARQIEVEAAQRPGRWRGALRSFMSRLAWRDHFMQKLEDEPAIEFRDMHPGLTGLRPQEPDTVLLAAWEKGETGYPFIDACMRSLAATGWMNFRMRAMLASFASYHLWQPWQASGQVLARFFTDYEPGIHWSQMQMQSGTTGINTIRIYNPVKQGRDQDPRADFIRDWVPELADVPADFLHEIWDWPGAERLAYPRPIVDPVRAPRDARERIFNARKAPGFKDEAAAVFQRHGSRSPVRRSGRRRAAAKPASAQLTLDL